MNKTNTLQNLIKNCSSGSTIIEFALIAPVFFLILMGIVELGLIFFTYSVLEGAAARGSRVGLTGYSVGAREDFIILQIAKQSGGYLQPSRATVEILSYSSFVNVGEPEPCISPPTAPCNGTPGINFVDINENGRWDEDQGASNAGGPNDIVLYKIKYAWPLFTPLMSSIIGNADKDFIISAVSTTKNESFKE